MHDEAGLAHDLVIIVVHAAADPVEHEANEAVFVKISDEGFVLFAGRDLLTFLVDDAANEISGEAIEKTFHALAVEGTIGIQHKRLVVVDGFENLREPLAPGVRCFLSGERRCGVLDTGPLDEVVDILKMIVKRHAADAAIVGEITDGDLVEVFFQEHIFQRMLQRFFRDAAHGCASFAMKKAEKELLSG